MGLHSFMNIRIPFVLLVVTGSVLAQSITDYTRWVARPAGEHRKLVEKAVTLKRGDSYQTVTNALGKPDLDQAFGATSGRSGPTQRRLHYNLSRPEGFHWESEHARFIQVLINYETERVDYIFIKATLQ